MVPFTLPLVILWFFPHFFFFSEFVPIGLISKCWRTLLCGNLSPTMILLLFKWTMRPPWMCFPPSFLFFFRLFLPPPYGFSHDRIPDFLSQARYMEPFFFQIRILMLLFFSTFVNPFLHIHCLHTSRFSTNGGLPSFPPQKTCPLL